MQKWPHAPAHVLGEAGAYIVTAGTEKKAHVFRARESLDFLQDQLLALAEQYGWHLQAWAIFSNHYHFVALSPPDAASLSRFVRHLHSNTARFANAAAGTQGRKVWFQYWDTHLTHERSYLARLAYVHTNAVKHGLTARANDYPWCSANWFEQSAPRSFLDSVLAFKTDQVQVTDPFQPVPPER